MKLKYTHFNQLLSMITQRRTDGWYYGNLEQFEKREKELEDWIKTLIVKEYDSTS